MDIVFFGSGPVASASLESLAKAFTIESVITKQAPAHHRGSVPVLELTQKLKLPVEFANDKTELDKLIQEKHFKSKVGVIVDYGVIVSRQVIDTFELGIINSHFSLLPEWRGADPITFTILSGQSETGVSLMRIVEELDEGPLIAQQRVKIPQHTTTPELTRSLIDKSNEMLLRYLPEYMAGRIKPYDQPNLPPTYSRKLTKNDGVLDWTKPAVRLEREVRAFIEWPKSRTTLADKDVVVTKSHVVNLSGKPGAVTIDHKQLIVACGEQGLAIDRLKPAGKPEMSIEAFLAGYRGSV